MGYSFLESSYEDTQVRPNTKSTQNEASSINLISQNYSISVFELLCLGFGFAGRVETHANDAGCNVLCGHRGALYTGIGLVGLNLVVLICSMCTIWPWYRKDPKDSRGFYMLVACTCMSLIQMDHLVSWDSVFQTVWYTFIISNAFRIAVFLTQPEGLPLRPGMLIGGNGMRVTGQCSSLFPHSSKLRLHPSEYFV
jgi:hypothetical protein